MEIFEYDDVIHHIVRELRMLRKGCYRISIVLQKYPDTCTRPQTGILNSLTQRKNNTTGWQCSVAFIAMLFE